MLRLQYYRSVEAQFHNFKRIKRMYASSSSAMKITTINQRELKQFDELSADWWEVKGPMIGLHMFNNLRVGFIRDELLTARDFNRRHQDTTQPPVSEVSRQSFPLNGFKIADIGCGAGILSEALVKLGADVTGVDVAPELISMAYKHAKLDPVVAAAVAEKSLVYKNEAVDKHAENHENIYDAVICSEVIEHVDEKEFFVKNAIKLVKNGGSLIFTTVNRTLIAWASVIFWSENIVKKIPKGTHHYNMFITPKELSAILEKNGCLVRTLQGTCANPSLEEFFYTDTLQFCYAIHAIKK